MPQLFRSFFKLGKSVRNFLISAAHITTSKNPFLKLSTLFPSILSTKYQRFKNWPSCGRFFSTSVTQFLHRPWSDTVVLCSSLLVLLNVSPPTTRGTVELFLPSDLLGNSLVLFLFLFFFVHGVGESIILKVSLPLMPICRA